MNWKYINMEIEGCSNSYDYIGVKSSRTCKMQQYAAQNASICLHMSTYVYICIHMYTFVAFLCSDMQHNAVYRLQIAT